MTDDHQPDAAEKVIRFGCGFLVGGPLAALALFKFDIWPTGDWLLVGLIGALAFGLLAIRYGDHFWRGLLETFRWF